MLKRANSWYCYWSNRFYPRWSNQYFCSLVASPVQVNFFVGYPGTLGASYMDYMIADRALIPKASQPFYAEKIAYLPETYQPNDRKRTRLEKRVSREEACLPQDGFVFCCFNNNFKITPQRLEMLAAIFKRVEDSLWCLLEDNALASGNWRRAIQKSGVDPNKLIFAPRVAPEKHLARISQPLGYWTLQRTYHYWWCPLGWSTSFGC